MQHQLKLEKNMEQCFTAHMPLMLSHTSNNINTNNYTQTRLTALCPGLSG